MKERVDHLRTCVRARARVKLSCRYVLLTSFQAPRMERRPKLTFLPWLVCLPACLARWSAGRFLDDGLMS